ncbi:hypothetical protein ABN028_08820 [Actinopolymorpha sp. B17G11]|uniref:hypothetical protein n=1 Tax=unclassified Actinopolymorpha TaxID=2627063 RepID=UPI0032D99D31
MRVEQGRHVHSSGVAEWRAPVDNLAGDHRGEVVGEGGKEVGVLENVEQLQGAPPANVLVLDRLEVLGFGPGGQPACGGSACTNA